MTKLSSSAARFEGKLALTIALQGLRCRYHLRSLSGSNGPIAKETSPLLGWRPILIFPQNTSWIAPRQESLWTSLGSRQKRNALILRLRMV
jgi:hypothetical protein